MKNTVFVREIDFCGLNTFFVVKMSFCGLNTCFVVEILFLWLKYFFFRFEIHFVGFEIHLQCQNNFFVGSILFFIV